TGTEALRGVSLQIESGEFFGLLGPNGAGKSTLIHCTTGLAQPTSGSIRIFGHDAIDHYEEARLAVGLAPQEPNVDHFLTCAETLDYHGGYFGMPRRDRQERSRELLDAFSLTSKKDERTRTLSGGMKRRVMIAKALSHEPQILFLDEPTAGVDVELRKGMWEVVRTLRAAGVTVILTTHYIEEAEEMADRIGVINKGEIILVEDKATLMQQLGKKRLKLHLLGKVTAIPPGLSDYNLELTADGDQLIYTYDTKSERTGITSLLGDLREAGIRFSDLDTTQSSLEDIFVSLVRK
ncbi:ABC transporter ATP-binding protein, partial [Tardiphaga sp.]|uniref:ABC transporter ATP-binding protein n=1 Tax=Tardiphaga sp. TaxID=1926292 RepID=UPI0026389650